MAGFYGLHLYDRPGFSYPPVWGYCLQILGSLVRLAGFGPSFFGLANSDLAAASYRTADFSIVATSPAYNLLFKGILFGFDLSIGVLIFRFVTHLTGDSRRARLAFAFWFLNPFVIYASAIQGAFDSIVGFSVLATIVLLLDGRVFWGGVAWAVGIMAKLSPVILLLQLTAVVIFNRNHNSSIGARLGRLIVFGVGVAATVVLLFAPEVVFGSVQGTLHSVFVRTQSPVVVGGLSFTAIRYLKPWAWVLLWAYQNSPALILASSIAQAAAVVAWGGWTMIVIRRSVELGLLIGAAGTLATFTLLSPISNLQYLLWWLPIAIVIVALTERGYWQVGLLSVAPLVFVIGILGPAAFLAPLATYTHLFPAPALASDVIQWYGSPGRLWGATLGDDFFAAGAFVSIAAMISLFVDWLSIPKRELRRFGQYPLMEHRLSGSR